MNGAGNGRYARCDGLCVDEENMGGHGHAIAVSHPGCPLHDPRHFFPSESGELRLRCWVCETVWDEDDLQQIQPDGRYACPFESCGVDTLEAHKADGAQ